MTFERTQDYELVRRILIEPSCYRRMVADDAPSREVFKVTGGNYIPIICRQSGGTLMGLFLLVPVPSTVETAQVHLCFLPSAWGFAEQAGHEFLAWVWEQTSLQTLVGPVPAYNRQALRIAKACGFRESKIKRNAVSKSGKEYDLIMCKIRRPKVQTK